MTIEEVVAYHDIIIFQAKERPGVRDLNAVVSALNSCRHHFFVTGEEDIIELACVMLLSMSRCQGFVQGNKRTAFVAAQAFLEANGYLLEIDDRKWIADMIIAAIENKGYESAVRSAIRYHTQAM